MYVWSARRIVLQGRTLIPKNMGRSHLLNNFSSPRRGAAQATMFRLLKLRSDDDVYGGDGSGLKAGYRANVKIRRTNLTRIQAVKQPVIIFHVKHTTSHVKCFFFRICYLFFKLVINQDLKVAMFFPK